MQYILACDVKKQKKKQSTAIDLQLYGKIRVDMPYTSLRATTLNNLKKNWGVHIEN